LFEVLEAFLPIGQQFEGGELLFFCGGVLVFVEDVCVPDEQGNDLFGEAGVGVFDLFEEVQDLFVDQLELCDVDLSAEQYFDLLDGLVVLVVVLVADLREDFVFEQAEDIGEGNFLMGVVLIEADACFVFIEEDQRDDFGLFDESLYEVGVFVDDFMGVGALHAEQVHLLEHFYEEGGHAFQFFDGADCLVVLAVQDVVRLFLYVFEYSEFLQEVLHPHLFLAFFLLLLLFFVRFLQHALQALGWRLVFD
jgi:hypothetical protein